MCLRVPGNISFSTMIYVTMIYVALIGDYNAGAARAGDACSALVGGAVGGGAEQLRRVLLMSYVRTALALCMWWGVSVLFFVPYGCVIQCDLSLRHVSDPMSTQMLSPFNRTNSRIKIKRLLRVSNIGALSLFYTFLRRASACRAVSRGRGLCCLPVSHGRVGVYTIQLIGDKNECSPIFFRVEYTRPIFYCPTKEKGSPALGHPGPLLRAGVVCSTTDNAYA